MESLVYQILRKKLITVYLESKGHRPVKSLSAGRFMYLCPFADHQESKPSFMVWTNSEFENFYCFGCQRHYSIIDLVVGLENISYRGAVTLLGEGVEVSLEEDVKLQIELFGKLIQNDIKDELAIKLLSISTRARYYLESVNYAKSELDIIDGFYAAVDQAVLDFDFETIDDYHNNLTDILRLRQDKFEQLERLDRC
jgi:hypothetical protein